MSFAAFGLVWGWLTDPANWTGVEGIPARVLQHLGYSGLALGVSALIALPVGLYTGHTRRGSLMVVSLANAARALPTLGLLVLAVLLSASELVPVLVPLVALAVPPILVNADAGVRQVDPDVRDAAFGMGMTGWTVLWRAEAPVALPLILLGLRTAAIQVVATATIAAYVGVGGLGRYIVDGLDNRDYARVGGGSLLVVALAVLVQLVFVLAERAAVPAGVRARAPSST